MSQDEEHMAVQGPEHISAESNLDSDSYDDAGSLMTDTASLQDNIRQYIIENGRRYGSNIMQYDFPNDEDELDRLDLLHHIFMLLLKGKLYMSPMTDKPTNILDIGTGTGIWAIDMADKFSGAVVVGTDIAAVQPEWVPPNLEFQIDDAEGVWTFPSDTYDMVHFRYMRGVFADWEPIMKQCLRILKPGGYMEIQDIEVKAYCDDDSLAPDSILHQFHENLYIATERSGRRMKNSIYEYAPLLAQVGFTNIQHQPKKCPVGTWAKAREYKELGAYMQLNSVQGYEGICMRLFNKWLGWDKERIDEFGERWKAEIRNNKVHNYYKFHFISGQKPYV